MAQSRTSAVALCRNPIKEDALTARTRSHGDAIAMIDDEALLKPSYSFRLHPVREIRGDMLDLGDTQIRAPAIAALTGTVTDIAAAACTIGAALEQRVSTLFATRRPLLGLTLDAIGTEKLFSLAERTSIRIRREARSRGLQAGPEANPGDAGFPIDQQPRVLALAFATDCGVTFGPEGMLAPLKSLSYIVPLGRDLPSPSLFRRCERCTSRPQCANRVN